MRRAIRAWCVVTALALSVVGPGALVAAGDDGPSRAGQTGRPTRTILRPTEIAVPRVTKQSDKEVIVLVSGIGSDAPDGTFDALIAALDKDPHYEIHRFGGDPAHPYDTLGSLNANADQLTAQIRELAKTHPTIDIVAHSMGGAVVDAAFQRGLSASDKVATYVALASPHNGSTEAWIGQAFLAASALVGAKTEFRAITAGVGQDIGSPAARDLATIHAAPPPPGVTRLELRAATDWIVTGPDAWTPGVSSRLLLPTHASPIEGHGAITADPHGIALITSTIATHRPPMSDWRDAALGSAAAVISLGLGVFAPLGYCVALLVGLGCAIELARIRRRRRIGARRP